MLGYINYNGDSIATNGGFFAVGTVKDPATGCYDMSKVRSFATVEEAKEFIDAKFPTTPTQCQERMDQNQREWETLMLKDKDMTDTDLAGVDLLNTRFRYLVNLKVMLRTKANEV